MAGRRAGVIGVLASRVVTHLAGCVGLGASQKPSAASLGLRGRVLQRARSWSVLLLVASSAGCTVKPAPPKTPPKPIAAAVVDDASFAKALHRLFREGAPTPQRASLLAGAVRRQLAHASEYFAAGRTRRGTQAVVGALYMLRLGELRAEMFDAQSQRALAGAIRRFSARGDVGRSLALMTMQKALLTPGSREALNLAEQLGALNRWAADTRTGLDMAVLSSVERAAVGRAMLEPSDSALMAAAAAVSRWIDRAVEYNLEFQQTRRLPPRGEAVEAFRALQSGAHVMAAIFLRYGHAGKALKVIESSSAGRVMRPDFFARLRAVVDDGTAEDWRTLAGDFMRTMRSGEDFPEMDTQLVDAALWGILLQAYRLDPTSLAVAHRLAGLAVKYGMSEVAPLILADATAANRQPVSLSGALDKIADILALEGNNGSPKVARRVYAASIPLLRLADATEQAKDLKPSTSDIRMWMAGIELRAGRPKEAAALLAESVQVRPSLAGYYLLASIIRNDEGGRKALAVLKKATDMPAAKIKTLAVARILLLRSEILYDLGQVQVATQALDAALAIAQSRARTIRNSTAQHRAWLLVARLADRAGRGALAAEALRAAKSLARAQPELLAVTLRRIVARSLMQGDVRAARAALQTGIMANQEPETMVQCAVWVALLEKRLGSGTDGKVERVLLDAVNQPGWTGQLARWARGMVKDQDLRNEARSFKQRVQYAFYMGLRAWSSKDSQQTRVQLGQVSQTRFPGLEEVALARELLRKVELP